MSDAGDALNADEAALLRAFTAGDHPLLATLRLQVATAKVGSRGRGWSGVGSFTDLVVPDDVPRLQVHRSGFMSDVAGEVAGVDGATFLLCVRYGSIDTLWGSTPGKVWPRGARLVRCFYVRPERQLLKGGTPSECSARDLDFALHGFGIEVDDAPAKGPGGEQSLIYVSLLGENVDCWRPVDALRLRDDTFTILGSMSEDEVWEFPPGSRVHCEIRPLSGGPVQCAVRLA
jgi:hypothetical protein